MAEEIRAKVVIDNKDAKKKLDNLKKSSTDLKSEIKGSVDNMGAFGITVGSVKNSFNALGKSIKLAGNSLKGSFIGMGRIFGVMFGGKTAAGAKMLFKVIKAGIASTGIGLLVVALGSIITYLTQTKKGAELISVAFKGVGAAISVITDRISAIGGAIIKVFKGDFKGAAEDAKNAVTGLGDEIRNETIAAIELGKAFNALKDSNRELNVETAARRSEIEALKLIAEDVTKSEQERLEAAEEAFKIENDLLVKRVANAEEALRIRKEENALGQSMAEDLDAEAQLEIDLSNIKQESVTKQIELNNKINAIKREAEAKELQRLQEIKAKRLEVLNADLALAKQNRNMREQIMLAGIEDEEKRELRALELKFKRMEEEIDRSKASDEKKEESALQLFKQMMHEREKIKQKFRDKEQQGEDELQAMRDEVFLMNIANAEERALKELDIKMQAELRAVEGTENAEEKKLLIKQKYTKLRNDLTITEAQFTMDSAMASADVVAGYLSMSAGKHVEGTKQWKNLKIAESLITGIQSGINAFNSAAQIPIIGPVLAPIAAAAALGMMQQNISKIKSTPIPEEKLAAGGIVGGMGTGTSDSVRARLSKGETVINANSSKMFLPLLSQINAAGGGDDFAPTGNTAQQNEGGEQVLKAYVLADDMSQNQDRLNKIRRRSSL